MVEQNAPESTPTLSELIYDGEGHLPSGLTVDLLGIAVDMEQEGRPLFAKWLRLMSAATTGRQS